MASRGINKFIGIGYVGRDPDNRSMPDGTAVTSVAVAISDSWKDKNTGEDRERTEWINAVAYGRLAEIITQYVKKGSRLYVEGALRTQSWEQDGVKRYKTEVVLSNMQMLGDPQDRAPAPAAPTRQPARQPQQQPTQQPTSSWPSDDSFNDDIPF